MGTASVVSPIDLHLAYHQIVLGPECKTMAEIERAVADIRLDLEQILVEACDKIAHQDSN